MSNKLSFGEWLASGIDHAAGNHHAPTRVIRVDAGHFNVSGLTRAAKSIDKATALSLLEDRKLTLLESFAIEVLIATAGWKDCDEAYERYRRYLVSDR